MSIKCWWSPYRLCCVIDKNIQSGIGGKEILDEALDAGKVAQIETIDAQTAAPLRKIDLLSITSRRIVGEACGDNHGCSGTQQFEARRISNLDAPARYQRDHAAQVGTLQAFQIAKIATARTVRMIKEVATKEVLFA